jgi:catechol 2,3-dioxygenase-like lactoylglutathione lyase family enzyme
MNWTLRTSALVLGALSVVTIYSVSAAREPHRPHIWRIAQVTLLSTNLPAAHDFYEKLLPAGHIACEGCAKVPNNAFMVNSGQSIYLSKAPSPTPANLLASVAFATDNLGELRRYLAAQGVECSPPAGEKLTDTLLSVLDPEKHHILFLKQPHYPELRFAREPKEKFQIIHAGFVVHDREAMDHFYKDILGFHVYWHGGMKDDEDHWIDMQVPDGTDWIEYMLNVSANADHHTLGVMNHIALGVLDIRAAREQLLKNGWKPGEEPKIGRDGKWQLNLYDPDDTRVELMEFTPTQKPCCSEYTGPHPGQHP